MRAACRWRALVHVRCAAPCVNAKVTINVHGVQGHSTAMQKVTNPGAKVDSRSNLHVSAVCARQSVLHCAWHFVVAYSL